MSVIANKIGLCSKGVAGPESRTAGRGGGGESGSRKKKFSHGRLNGRLYLLASSDCWKALRWHNSFLFF